MHIDEALFNHLANLSQLSFQSDEKERIMKDLEKMIDFVGQLQHVDTTNVEPLWYMGGNEDVLREDETQPMLSAETALSNANNKNSQFFLVPKVIQKP